MIALSTRRLAGVTIVLVIVAILAFGQRVWDITLVRPGIYSGWTLLFMLFGLAMFNLRKKLTALQVGGAVIWLQVHIYVGLLSGAVFILHAGVDLPNGGLSLTLAILYWLVAVTGLIGLALSRWLPPRLSRRGEEVLFERIPAFRNQLREQAEALILESVSEGTTTTIAEFYTHRVVDFFAGPRHVWAHLVGSDKARHALLAECDALDRYLGQQERTLLKKLEILIEKKDDLDYQYAGQAALKYWLFAHVPLTYSLLLVSLLHGVVVYAFSGAVR